MFSGVVIASKHFIYNCVITFSFFLFFLLLAHRSNLLTIFGSQIEDEKLFHVFQNTCITLIACVGLNADWIILCFEAVSSLSQTLIY